MSVTGLGGFFFECPDPESLQNWYSTHLGLRFGDRGGAWFHERHPSTGVPVFSVFAPVPHSIDYFDPGTQPFMISYRVQDLAALTHDLKASGETVLTESVERETGTHAWVVDPDGQKVELWEPSDAYEPPGPDDGPARGLGGVFFKSPDSPKLKEWYSKLGIAPGKDGYVTFQSALPDGGRTFTAWEVFPRESTYFDSGDVKNPHSFMINFRVDDLDTLLERLNAGGVCVDPKTEEYRYGKFGWISDPIGARIELWEPL